MILSVLLFILTVAPAIQGLLCFHTNFRIIYSSSVENVIGVLIGVALNLYIILGSVVILTILILLIHEQYIYFHL